MIRSNLLQEKDKYHDILYIENDREICNLSSTIQIEKDESPIRLFNFYPPYYASLDDFSSDELKEIFNIQIYDKDRVNIIYDYDFINKKVYIDGNLIPENELQKFKWFRHRDMGINPYVTINLDALANKI